MKWSFFNTWNEALETNREREYEKRDHLWASEIGSSYADVFLKLKGVQPTNPPNIRSLRKFEAGNLWEWIVEIVLKRSGVLKEAQTHLKYQYPGLMEVTGRLDFLVGGKPNWNKAEKDIKELGLPEFLNMTSLGIIKNLRKDYPKGIPDIVLEIKSCSSFMFERYLETEQPSDHHRMQCFHYLKSTGLPEGHVVYICKDDCQLLEFPIYLKDQETEMEYKNWITEMTRFHKDDVEPPKEKEILFDKGKFSKSWRTEYSGYLTMLYGYEAPRDYSDAVTPKVSRFNRVLQRIKDEKKMTEKNLQVIKEIEKDGYKIKDLVK